MRSASALLLLLLGSLAGCQAQPRGSTYGKPGVQTTAPPVLTAMTPSSGVREQGVVVTLYGAGFKRSRGLCVRFATAAGASIVVPATYIDSGTIVCSAPAQPAPGLVYVTASNDGSVFSAAPVPGSARAGGSWVSYTVADSRPWGQWRLTNDTFPAAGASTLSVALTGGLVDGAPTGGALVDTGLAWCAFSASLLRVFSAFTQPAYLAGGGAGAPAAGADAQLLLPLAPAPAWAAALQSDQVYSLLLLNASAFAWWRAPAGAPGEGAPGALPPGGPMGYGSVSTQPAPLELGLTAAFATLAAKRAGDSWSWRALTANPSRVAALGVQSGVLRCPVPAYAALQPDADPGLPGLQHELKLSLAGPSALSAPQLFAAPGGGATLVGGAPQQPITPLGADGLLHADGYYSGDAVLTYEVVVGAGGGSWSWRRYSGSPSACDLAAFAAPRNFSAPGDASTGWQALDAGVFVRFETAGGKAAGWSWVFTAQPLWSTPFSPVAGPGVAPPPAPPPATRLLPSGLLTATGGAWSGGAPASWTFQVTANASDATRFSWLRWPAGAAAGAAAAVAGGVGPVSPASAPAPLDLGVSVGWSAPAAVAPAAVWTFTAFAGHAVSFGAASAWGFSAGGSLAAALAGGASAPPLLCDALGRPLSPAFTGAGAAAVALQVAPGGAAFSWSVGAASGTSPIGTAPVPLAQGLYALWPAASATPNASYALWAAAVPNTAGQAAAAAGVATPAPGLALAGAYYPAAAAATRDATLSLLVLNSTAALWRVGSAAFQPLSLATGGAAGVALGGSGLALLLPPAAAAALSAGDRYTFLLSSWVPVVENVTSMQAGGRAAAAFGPVLPAAGNVGLPVGVALPYATNTGGASPAISGVLPTPGFSPPPPQAAGAAAPSAYAEQWAYPALTLRIAGAPSVGPITGPLPGELRIGGAYAAAEPAAFALQAGASAGTFQLASFWPPGPVPAGANWSAAASPPLAASGLSLSFASASYPAGTTWQFVASAGATFEFRTAGGAWSAPRAVAAGAVELCCGVSVNFSAAGGYAPGDQWSLLPLSLSPAGAYSGQADANFSVAVAPGGATFSWSLDGGAWSAPLAMAGADQPLGDPANASPPAAPPLLLSGAFNGSADALFVVEALPGSAWRLGSAPPIPFLAAQLQALGAGGFATATLANGTAWGAAQAYSVGVAAPLGYGLALAPTAPLPPGDLFYIPARAPGSPTPLALGVSVVWSAPGGYSAGDGWSFAAFAPIASRGPLEGRTRLLLQGRNFLPSVQLSCLLSDAAGRAPTLAPAAYLSPTAAACLTPPRAPDGLSLPVPSRAGAPALTLAGAYAGPRSVTLRLAVSAAAGGALQLTSQLLDGAAASPPAALGSVAALADGASWVPLPDGLSGAGLEAASRVFARFAQNSSAAAYLPGDAWTATAYALSAAEGGGGDAHPLVQPGGVQPGVLVAVAASNDGAAWSDGGAAGGGLLRHLYSPVYVSPEGDDGAGGDGTRAAPYATLARAVQAALAGALQAPGGAPGLGGVSNWDELVLLPGRYAGSGNAGVAPAGRALLLVASQRGAAVIDCAGAPGGDVVQGDKWASVGGGGAGSASLQGVATENCGAFAGSVGSAFPTQYWWGSG